MQYAKYKIKHDSYYSYIKKINYLVRADNYIYFATFRDAKKALKQVFQNAIDEYKSSLKHASKLKASDIEGD